MKTYEIRVEFTAFDWFETFTVEAVSPVAATDYVQAAYGTNDMVFVTCRQWQKRR